MAKEKNTCPNCDYVLTQYYKYCPNCAQKVDDHLSMKVLFHNTIMNYFSVDARFFRSFIPMLTKPGYLAKEFIKGKRLLYLHPAQLYLFASIVFFFLFSIATKSSQNEFDKVLKKSFTRSEAPKDSLAVVGNDPIAQINAGIEEAKKQAEKAGDTIKIMNDVFGYDVKKMDSMEQANASIEDRLALMGINNETNFFRRTIAKQMLKFREKKGGGLLTTFYDTIPISMFFLIPIFALLLKLLYRKKGSFAHHMVFSFHFFAFIFLTLSIILLINFIVDIPDWIDVLVVLSMFIYLIISLKRFYEQGYLKTIFKTILLTFIYGIFVVPLSIAIMWVVSFFLY